MLSDGTRQHLRNFGETTSVRGVSRVLKSKSKFVFVLWTLTVVACTVVLIYNLTTVFVQYYSYRYSTVYRESVSESEKPIFPDVTVCNNYPSLDSSAGEGGGLPMTWSEYARAISAKQQRWPLDTVQEKCGLQVKPTEYEYETCWTELKSRTGFFTSLPVTKRDRAARATSSTLAAAASTSGGGGTSSQQLVVDCTLLGWTWEPDEALNCTDLVQPNWDPNYYQCYTIGLAEKDQQLVRSMSLILYLNDFDVTPSNDAVNFDPTLSTAAGVRLVVHEPGTTPDTKLGFTVGPGSEATAKVTLTKRRRLPEPYSSCTDEQTLDEGDERYSYETCIEACLQQQVINECQCVLNMLKFTKAQLIQVGYKICGNQTSPVDGLFQIDPDKDLDGFCQLYCATFQWTIDWTECQSLCSRPCAENQYAVSMTTATDWPHPAYQMAFYDRYVRGNGAFGARFDAYAVVSDLLNNGSITQQQAVERMRELNLLSRNFVQLNIVLDRIAPYEMIDSPEMSGAQLLSSVGGVLSLWLGVTIMTAVELLELIYVVVGSWHERHRAAGKIKVVDVAPQQPNN